MKSLQQYIQESKHDSFFVNMGLTSGTKWDDSVKKYSWNKIPNIDNVPTKKDFQELIKNCSFEVSSDKKYGVFTANNGGTIKLPLSNGVGSFWTSTESEGDEKEFYACALMIDNSGVSFADMNKEKRYGVLNITK